ncbi:MAG: GNAT family N-acetyltransferase [Ignavibacteriales bacterium]|nr:GNAT family N-acetyltransferase [Ignavibacteriales bacterium]
MLVENELRIRIKKCNNEDLNDLLKIGIDTYFDTFNKYCSKDVMENYLEEAFERNKIHSEMMNKDSHFFFVYANEKLSGYLKININDAQCDLKDENGLEIERIYVKKEYKGKGIGYSLINFGIEKAKEFKKDFIWLGVWEKNREAIEFYKKNGFSEIGMHSFRMGNEIQNDFVMKRNLI